MRRIACRRAARGFPAGSADFTRLLDLAVQLALAPCSHANRATRPAQMDLTSHARWLLKHKPALEATRHGNDGGATSCRKSANGPKALPRRKATACAEATLPFLLLEDLFERQTVDACKGTWKLIEERAAVLTGPTFVPDGAVQTKSKILLLKIANELLRRLSRTTDAVFRGRIMLFLAYAYPLAERSGVNVAGTFNTENRTPFDDSGTFACMAACYNGQYSHSDADYKLYSVFWGVQRLLSSSPAPLVAVETKFLLKQQRAQGSAAEVGQSRGTSTGKKHHIAEVAEKNADAGKVPGSTAWTQFIKCAATVLCAFEDRLFTDADFKAAKDAAEAGRNGTNARCDGHLGCRFDSGYQTKYLASSRLFELQLQDPELRRNVLLQFLIFVQNVEAEIQRCHDGLALLAESRRRETMECRKQIYAGGSKDHLIHDGKTKGRVEGGTASGPAEKKRRTTHTRPLSRNTYKEFLQPRETEHVCIMRAKAKELVELRRRCWILLKNTPPDGDAFASDVEQILTKEHAWVRWKAMKCPPFERELRKFRLGATSTDASLNGCRRAIPNCLPSLPLTAQSGKRMSLPRSSTGKAMLWEGGLDMSSLKPEEVHESLLKCLEEDQSRPKLPGLANYLHPLLEAMDPENCIEEEYHPHNDSVYMWKGLRLLMNHGKMANFDSVCVKTHNASGGEKVIEAILNKSERVMPQ